MCNRPQKGRYLESHSGCLFHNDLTRYTLSKTEKLAYHAKRKRIE